MDWEEFLASLKSAEVIEDPEQIAKVLEDRVFKLRATVGQSLHTQVKAGDDGRTSIVKLSGGRIEAKANGAPPIPSGDELKKLFSARGISFDQESAERVVPYFASDERVDAHGDIVKQNWFFDEFKVNPVLPFSHRWHDLPVGSSLKEQVVQRKDGKGSQKYEGPALWLLGVFANAETNPFADTVFRLIKAGMLKSGSVGFYSEKVIDIKDEDERNKLGLGRFGVILDKNHLLEFSPTMLPANTGAFSLLSLAKQENLIVANDFDVIRELWRQQVAGTDEDLDKVVRAWREFDGNLRTIGRNLFPELELKEHEDFEAPIVEYKTTEPEGEPEGEPENEVIELAGTNERIDRVERKLDRMIALMEEALIGQGRSIEDIRELVEGLAERAGIEVENDNEHEEESDGPQDDSRVEELLRNLDEARSAAGEVLSA